MLINYNWGGGGEGGGDVLEKNLVRFLESKDSEQRNWPRDVLESKDVKDAKRAYRQKCECFITEDGLLFKTKRQKKGLTSVQEEERYRVVTVDE